MTFRTKGWRFKFTNSSVPSRNEDIEAFEAALELNPGEHLPEVVWLQNSCRISNAYIELEIDTAKFIQGTLNTSHPCQSDKDPLHNYCLCPLDLNDSMELPFAEHWRSEIKQGELIQSSKSWTHLSGFKGHIQAKSGAQIERQELQAENHSLPMNLLQDTSLPILYFKQIPLAEDDLSDCGHMETGIKLRVMPTFFYLALSQLIRIDGSIQRQRTVRIFHQFGTFCLLRETTVEDHQHVILDLSQEDESLGHKLGLNLQTVRSLERLSWKTPEVVCTDNSAV